MSWTLELITVYVLLLLTVLADAGVRNAPTIAAAEVAAAETQTVRLPGEEVAAGSVSDPGVISLDGRIKTTDADIVARSRRVPLAEVSISMPGTGFRLGAEFLAVGGPTLIGSADQLASWDGLGPFHSIRASEPDDCTHPSATVVGCAG